MSCGYEAPHFGAHYPDATCIDGYLWDLDSGDADGLTSGGDVPCPACKTSDYIEWTGSRASGNARQRRRVRRLAAHKVRLWAMRRSSFPCGVGGMGSEVNRGQTPMDGGESS